MTKLIPIALSCLVACSSSVLAQGKEPVSAGFEHKFDADVDGGGSVSVDRWDAGFAVPLKRSEDFFSAVTFSYGQEKFDFGAAFDPWSKLRVATIALPVKWRIRNSWTWSSMTKIGSAYEQGADHDESYNWSHVFTFDHHMRDDLTLGAGLSISSKLEDDLSIFPVMSIDWQLTDSWSITTIPSDGVNTGANVAFKYTQTEGWSYLAGIMYASKRFRLSETSGTAVNGVGEESYAALYGVAKYQPSAHFSVSLIAGYSFGNQYSVYDSVGEDVVESDADATPFAGMRLNYEF